jgi:hypothetical protein
MGSFNVACSISNLSISQGEKVVFIPLIPPTHVHMGFENNIVNTTVGTNASMLIYPNCFFDPFCLPIEGEYNEYGTLENIKKDANIEAIEKFTGLDIEDFMSIVTESRGVNDYFSNIFKHFAIEQDIIKDAAKSFGPRFLIKMGFEALKKEGWYDYKYKDLQCLVHIENIGKGYKYKILNSKGLSKTNISNTYSDKSTFLNDFFNFIGYHINVANNDQQMVNLLSSIAGMFVNKEVYDPMINAEFVGLFDTDMYPKSLSKKFDEAVDLLTKQTEEDDDVFYFYDLEDKLFDGYFRNWYFFLDMYTETIISTKIKKILINFLKFRAVMNVSNRFFFPAMNGEQYGNIEASKLINDVTSKIISRKIHTCSECGKFSSLTSKVQTDYMIDENKFTYTTYLCEKCLNYNQE